MTAFAKRIYVWMLYKKKVIRSREVSIFSPILTLQFNYFFIGGKYAVLFIVYATDGKIPLFITSKGNFILVSFFIEAETFNFTVKLPLNLDIISLLLSFL